MFSLFLFLVCDCVSAVLVLRFSFLLCAAASGLNSSFVSLLCLCSVLLLPFVVSVVSFGGCVCFRVALYGIAALFL